MNQLTPLNSMIQDDPLENLLFLSNVDPSEANRLFDEYFGTLIPDQQTREDQLQLDEINDSTSSEIGSEIPHGQVHAAQNDIYLLQNLQGCSETEFESSQSEKSSVQDGKKTPEVSGATGKNNLGQESPTHSSPTSPNQSRTGVGTSFESRVRRKESSRTKLDRKKADAKYFRQRFRNSLRNLNSAVDCHLGIKRRSQIQIIDSATKLLQRN